MSTRCLLLVDVAKWFQVARFGTRFWVPSIMQHRPVPYGVILLLAAMYTYIYQTVHACVRNTLTLPRCMDFIRLFSSFLVYGGDVHSTGFRQNKIMRRRERETDIFRVWRSGNQIRYIKFVLFCSRSIKRRWINENGLYPFRKYIKDMCVRMELRGRWTKIYTNTMNNVYVMRWFYWFRFCLVDFRKLPQLRIHSSFFSSLFCCVLFFFCSFSVLLLWLALGFVMFDVMENGAFGSFSRI